MRAAMSAATKWTIAIVGLLAGNLIAMVVLMTVARSGASEVIPNYYDRGANYDREIDAAARSRDLGWSAEVTLVGSTLAVHVRDRAGFPVDAARVQVTGYPRAHAAEVFDAALAAGESGMYRAALPGPAIGVHDVTVVIERAGSRFTTTAAVEAR
jgi:nitrogen fixation protein FixH